MEKFKDFTASDYKISRAIFSASYKSGLIDAEDYGDEYYLKPFEEDVSKPGVYGRINSYERYDIEGWRIQILLFPHCQYRDVRKFLLVPFDKNALVSVVYPLAMDFYLLGVKDYFTNPTIHDFGYLDNRRFERWTKDGLETLGKDELLSFVQIFSYNRKMIDKQKHTRKDHLTLSQYELFAMRFWGHMSKTEIKY